MRTYLLGNGLSLSFNPQHFRLPTLTDRVRERLATHTTPDGGNLRSELERIARSMETDSERRSSSRSFERIAGPLDRLSTALDHMASLVSIAPDSGTRSALRQMSRRLRRIYVRVVGVVLEVVSSDVDGEWGNVNAVAEHLGNQARVQGAVDVFTLNYDALLDSALLETSSNSDAFSLMDEFDGRFQELVGISVGRGRQAVIPALRWREDSFLPASVVRLHHLHGAATWMSEGEDVFKARSLQHLRDVGLFSAWARGDETEIRPTVVLGDQKSRAVERWPFSEAYEQLALSIESAETIVIAGYGFGDTPINRTLRRNLRDGSNVFVITPSVRAANRVRRELLLDPSRLRVVEASLPDGLDQV